jgi:hypothetical protein
MDDYEHTDSAVDRDAETHILGQIVDAMLAAESVLQNATPQEWEQILVASCRRQKRTEDRRNVALTAT